MGTYYWSDWYFAWGWFLWFGVFFLFFSSLGNWGYTYRAYQRLNGKSSHKEAIHFLKERYAKGEIDRDEFHKIKSEITHDHHGLIEKNA